MDINQISKPSNTSPAAQEAAQQAVLHAAIAAAAPKQVNGQGDSVQLSQTGSLLNHANSGSLEWGLPVKTLPPIPHTAQQLDTWINEFRDAVRKSIEKIFSQNNVQLQQPVTLQNNSDGSVQVDGSHPQAQQIQQLLNQNPQLGGQLQSLNQRAELYQVLSHGNDLRQASNDGEHSQAAAALSDYLNNPAPYRLTVNPPASEAANGTGQA